MTPVHPPLVEGVGGPGRCAAGILRNFFILMPSSHPPSPQPPVGLPPCFGQPVGGVLGGGRRDAAMPPRGLCVGNYRGDLRRRSEQLFVAASTKPLQSDAADKLLDSLRNWFDEAAANVSGARDVLPGPEQSVEQFMTTASTQAVAAWQRLNSQLAILEQIGAIASQFGCRAGRFPLLENSPEVTASGWMIARCSAPKATSKPRASLSADPIVAIATAPGAKPACGCTPSTAPDTVIGARVSGSASTPGPPRGSTKKGKRTRCPR
jgi:hypothetical protein